MIVGRFGVLRPCVSALIGIPRLRVSGTVEFLVDTGAAVTCLHPSDGVALHVSFDRLDQDEYIVGVGGISRRYVERAVLTFGDEVSLELYVCEVDIRVGRPGEVGSRLPSVLGQDVLARWVMVHDPVGADCNFTRRGMMKVDNCQTTECMCPYPDEVGHQVFATGSAVSSNSPGSSPRFSGANSGA